MSSERLGGIDCRKAAGVEETAIISPDEEELAMEEDCFPLFASEDLVEREPDEADDDDGDDDDDEEDCLLGARSLFWPEYELAEAATPLVVEP